VRRVDVEEYPRDHDRFLFEELFEEGLCEHPRGLVSFFFFGGVVVVGYETYETVVQGWWKVIQVQPDIERADWWNVHFQPQLPKPLENVISFRLEVYLQGQLHNIAP